MNKRVYITGAPAHRTPAEKRASFRLASAELGRRGFDPVGTIPANLPQTPRKYICCICGRSETGYGHNPWPLQHGGECCSRCNQAVLIKRKDLTEEE